ncbi:MAG: PaaI family thioesterase [Mycobacterium sp.]|nr:PaaI family thioesterase [Mycobacterium sp.]
MIQGLDPETPLSVLRRFGVNTLEQDMATFTVVAEMPVAGMRNPFTGLPSLAALGILIDDVAGRVNYNRRPAGLWTVSSELTVDISPGALDHVMAGEEHPVVASARPVGPPGATLLSVCTLTHHGIVIGGGTVRTMPLPGGPESPLLRGDDPLVRTPQTSLAELMAVQPLPAEDDTYRLLQTPDPMINNLIGIVHGGVSSAGLELVASAAINQAQETPFRTASVRVNFLRPFAAGDQPGAQSVYEARALRVGRTSAIADAAAIGTDGRPAVIARITGYR